MSLDTIAKRTAVRVSLAVRVVGDIRESHQTRDE
jgi:hypothetical protein